MTLGGVFEAFETALAKGSSAHAIEALSVAFKQSCSQGARVTPEQRETAYNALLACLNQEQATATIPVAFDRPATVHLVTPGPMLVQQRAALFMMLHIRPHERHVVMFTGPEPDVFLCEMAVAQGAFVLAADANAELPDRWHWIRGRLETLLPERVVVHAEADDVLAGLAARLVAQRFGPRLYLLHHGNRAGGVIPDFVSNTLQQATHLVARPESEPLLRAAFSDSTQVQVAHLPTAADPALARRLDRWIDAQEQLESRSGRMSLRTRLSGLGHRLRKSGRVLKDMVTTSGPVTASFGDLTELPPPVIAEFADHLIACLEAGVERHVHFGPTARRVERMVAAQLLAAGLKADSILFIGQKISIKDALAKHKVDLVLAGFAQIPPVGMIDVVAAGVPLALREEPSGVYSSDIPTAVWTEAQDVVDLISSGETATAQAAMQWYQTHATRAVFERLWNAIVTATEGPMRDDLTPEQIRAATIRLFDAEWYLTHNPDVKNAGRDPLEHYLADGEREGCAPCALFHPRHYAATLGRNDCPKTGLLAHYLTYGEARGHSPHPLFAPRQMQQSLSFEAGLAAASTDETVLEKYMTSYGTDVVPHPLFDPVHYARGLAVPPANQPLLLHFLETGAYDGLSPHPLIEAQMLATWGDKPLEALFEWAGRPAASPSEPSPAVLFDPVHFCGSDHARYANAAPNLLWAYLIEGNRRTRGPHLLVEPAHVARRRPDVLTHNRRPVLLDMAQGRMDGIDTHPLVSVSHILEQAPWVGQSGEHPTRYFVTRAADENLNSHPYFSTQVYLLKNPDVAEAGLNPLVHYLTYGQYEGRLPHLFFDGNDYYARYLRDKGGDSPLLHYVRHGAGDYLPILPHDGAHHSMGLKTARAMFLAQTDAGQAEAILKATIHPDWGAPHPTLEVRSLPRAPERDKTVKATTVYPARQVTLSRPAVMAGAYIAPPSVAYTAPSVTVGCWPGTTVIGGNDGFVTGAGAWHAEGPECGPLPDTAQAQDSDLELRGQTSVVARRKDAVLLRHFHHEQAVARAIMACGSRSHLFDHFMLEVLPRVMCAARVAPVGTPVLIEDDLPRLHHQALRLAVPDHPILQVARGSQIKVAQLYAASMGTHLGSPRKAPGGPAQPGPAAVLMHPALIDLLGQLADQAGAPEADLPVAQKTAARLFLYTQDPAYRALLNFEEIADALGDRGFAMRDFDALSFTRLARYIAQADEIVITDGPHIAALAFARPDARIYVLLSNAPGTDFHRADIIGRLRGAQVVSFAGWQHQGSGGFKPEDAHFNLPVEHVKPFFGQTVLPTTQQPLDKLLTGLRDFSFEADVLTGAWAVLAGDTPCGFAGRVVGYRRAARVALEGEVKGAKGLLAHEFFADYGRNLRSGFTAFADLDAAEVAAAARVREMLCDLAESGSDTADLDADEQRCLLMRGMLLLPNWQVPLPQEPQRLPEDVLERWVHWASLPPFLGRAGEDLAWVAHVARLLDWIADGLDATQSADLDARDAALRRRLLRLLSGLDLGQLLLVDAPLNAVQRARNRVLEHVALRSGTPRSAVRALPVKGVDFPVSEPQKQRIGILCRTFEKGPDSEAVVAFFRRFDPAHYEIYAYSVGFRDRVASRDPEFDTRFDNAITHRRELPGDPSGIRSQILADDLDVFLYANATTYGIQPMDIALYHRVAPVQAVLNSHVPMAMGYPSFDAVITGLSDDPAQEVAQEQHSETLIRVPGPVISYLTSFEPRKTPALSRADLGLLDTDIVMMNAGSSMKLRHESLRAMMRSVVDVPHAKLLLAPYNPGWAARSLAFAFNVQVAEVAAEVGLDPARIVILGELSVTEAEAALSCADIYLNPFPHGGATMTHLALIYGVPPVTLRRGSTRSIDQFLVSALGFEELLASDVEAYVALAQRLARDTALRTDTATRLKQAARNPVFVDSPQHSKAMQKALEHLVRNA